MNFFLKLFGLLFLAMPIFTIACDAEVTGLLIGPDNHDFGFIPIGDEVSASFTISNISTKSFRISRVRLVGNLNSSFTIMPGVYFPRFIRPNSIISLTIKFAPTVANRSFATMEVFHDGPLGVNRISMTGKGLAVPRIYLPETS